MVGLISIKRTKNLERKQAFILCICLSCILYLQIELFNYISFVDILVGGKVFNLRRVVYFKFVRGGVRVGRGREDVHW